MTSRYTLLFEITPAVSPTNHLKLSLVQGNDVIVATALLAGQLALVAAHGVAPYAYLITAGALPAGTSLNTSTGAITGTPSANGKNYFTAQTTDSLGEIFASTFEIDVGSSITISGMLPWGEAFFSYSSSLKADGGTPPYTWSLASGSLPSTLSIDASTGIISGTAYGPIGVSINSIIRVTDSLGQYKDIPTTMVVADGLGINFSTFPPGNIDTPYAFNTTQLIFAGVSPYIFSATGLPPGLNINTATGLISGIPTSQGSYSITIYIYDLYASTYFSSTINIGPATGLISSSSTIQVNQSNPITGLLSVDGLDFSGTASANTVAHGDGSWSEVANADMATMPALAIKANATNASATPTDLAGTNVGDFPYVEQSQVVFDDFLRYYRNVAFRYCDFESGITGTIFSDVSSSGSLSSTNPQFNCPGWLSLNAANSVTPDIAGYISSINLFKCGLGRLVLEQHVATATLATVTDDYIVQAGFVRSANTAAATGVWFEYNRASTGDFWVICTASGGTATRTTTSTAITANAEYLLRAVVNAAGTSVTFYINGTSVGTITTNIPTGITFGLGGALKKTAGSINRSFYVDSMGYLQNLTASR